MTIYTIVRILTGLILLAMGRRLYWLFVAVLGFLAGSLLATNVLQGQSEITTLLIALAAGIIGAIFAVFLQKVAIAIAGFFAGGYLLALLLSWFAFRFEGLQWLVFLMGGILGAILAIAVFDWALILLSSLIGATLVVQGVNFDRLIELFLFFLLFFGGAILQSETAPREKPPG